MSSTIEAANQFVIDFDSIYSQIREALVKTQTQYTQQANKHRKHMILNEGDFVMLRIEKRRLKSVETNPIVKLAPRFYGPFRVTTKINDLAYRLDLPPHSQFHYAFHFSLLRPFKGPVPTHHVLKQPPDLVDQEEQLHPEAILDHETTTTETDTIYNIYLLTFKNQPRENAQWMPERFFRDYPNLIHSYNQTLAIN